MKPMSRLLHRMSEAVTPAERPIVVVVVLADTTRTLRTLEADRPPQAEAAPGATLPHLDFDLAIRLFDDLPSENTRKAYVG